MARPKPTIPRHTCGKCDACCVVLPIACMNKPAGVRCAFLEEKGGCSVYANRPEECRGFRCAWLDQKDAPEDFRPDRCGILAFESTDSVRVLAQTKDGALETEKGRRMIDAARASGKKTIIMAGDELRVLNREEDSNA